ncbi:MAG: hypothetical protein QNJ38_20515 [Prochloraceae cyanobacterium]|nr:hypothetical protein [Prochloraceae cyanobacterium]
MSSQSSQLKKNSQSMQTSLEKLSQSLYQRLLETNPQFKNLSDRTEAEILQRTLVSSMQEVLNNYQEYLESYYLEKLKQNRFIAK